MRPAFSTQAYCCWRLRVDVMSKVIGLKMILGVFLSVCLSQISFGQAPETSGLTSISAIRVLPRPAAEQRPRFKVRATVTYSATWGKRRLEMGLHDGTAGIYASPKEWGNEPPKFGQEIEVSGRVHPGTWAPFLDVDQMRVIGEGGLPTPREADFFSLQAGVLDSQFVEVEGVVRDVQYDDDTAPPSTIITLAVNGGRAEIFAALQPEAPWRPLVDAKVRARGVVFHYFNPRRQVFAFRIMVCDPGQIDVIEPAGLEPPPLLQVGQLLQFDDQRPLLLHRIRVHGVVSLHWPGEFLFLQDGPIGLLVRSRQWEPLRPGDEVEVTAFPAMGAYAGLLEDATFRKLGRKSDPTPMPTALEELAKGESDARLVQTEGELANIAETGGRAVVMLRKGKLLVPAELPTAIGTLPPLEIGSTLSVTGICQVNLGSQRRFARLYLPESARLLLRSAGDVRVARAAPWWNERRLSVALGSAGIAIVVIAAWTWSLQNRNEQLRKQIEARRRAELEVQRRRDEQTILAADLHDSLEQTLTGVALQLRAARDELPENATSPHEHMVLAERLLDHSRAGVHRAVRDLRQSSQEPMDLAQELRELVRMASTQQKVRIELSLSDRLPDMPAQVQYHLVHFAQEGVTNALKHAGAQRVEVSLQTTDEFASVIVSDDGRGFDLSASPGPAQGHFGIQGMRERASRMNGALHLETKPGSGTRLTLSIPIH